MALYNHDIFLNVAGRMRIDEPAVDLGIVSAIASSFLDKPVDPKMVIFGEVGLAGEVRGISRVELRIKEAQKLGFNRCLLPKSNQKRVRKDLSVELIGVSSVKETLNLLF